MEGFVITTTGVPSHERSLLESKVIAMKGKFQVNFDGHVTHLVAEDVRNSQKYKVALQHKIPILTTEWIEKSYRLYLENTSFKASSIINSYNFGFFQGLQIVATGLDLNQRNELKSVVEKYGGQYCRDLTAECTHLVSIDSTSAKHKYAIKHGIPIVSLDWIRQSVKAQMPLFVDQVGNTSAREIENDEINDDYIPNKAGNFLNGCKIYVSKAFTQSKLQTIRGQILNSGATRMPEFTKTVTHYLIPSKIVSAEDETLLKSKPLFHPRIVEYRWLRECCVEEKRVFEGSYQVELPEDENVKENGDVSAEKIMPQKPNILIENLDLVPRKKTAKPVTKKTIESSLIKQPIPIVRNIEPIPRDPTPNDASDEVFNGWEFALKGFSPDKEDEIVVAICASSGTIVSFSTTKEFSMDKRRVIIAPLEIPQEPKVETLTDLWVERCLFNKELMIADDVFDRPLSFQSIEGFSKLKISITQIQGLERAHLQRKIERLGAGYSDSFSKQCSLLISNEMTGPKFERACAWGIPVVHPKWIEHCALNGRLVENEDFLMNHVKGMSIITSNHVSFSSHITSSNNAETPSEAADILKGVRICISLKLSHERAELRDLAMEMGAMFLGSPYSEDCTHYLHMSSKDKETFKEFKLAKKHKKYIISPFWLRECKRLGIRLKEESYPHTYNPSKFLNIQVNKKSVSSSSSLSISSDSSSTISHFSTTAVNGIKQTGVLSIFDTLSKIQKISPQPKKFKFEPSNVDIPRKGETVETVPDFDDEDCIRYEDPNERRMLMKLTEQKDAHITSTPLL